LNHFTVPVVRAIGRTPVGLVNWAGVVSVHVGSCVRACCLFDGDTAGEVANID
jgi:hypothetical protein